MKTEQQIQALAHHVGHLSQNDDHLGALIAIAEFIDATQQLRVLQSLETLRVYYTEESGLVETETAIYTDGVENAIAKTLLYLAAGRLGPAAAGMLEAAL